jgi:hypothetical protein
MPFAERSESVKGRADIARHRHRYRHRHGQRQMQTNIEIEAKQTEPEGVVQEGKRETEERPLSCPFALSSLSSLLPLASIARDEASVARKCFPAP